MRSIFLTDKNWVAAEEAVARRYGLSIYPADERIEEFLLEEIKQAKFTEKEILAEFQQFTHSIIEFSIRWQFDCGQNEYGEEWNPEEGDQQTDAPIDEAMALCQGFLVSNTLFYLYAKYKPESLLEFLKLRRIPHARKVAQDIRRVFSSLATDNT